MSFSPHQSALTRRRFLIVAAGGAAAATLVGCGSGTGEADGTGNATAGPTSAPPPVTTTSTAAPTTTTSLPTVGTHNVTFSINVQDFAYPDLSAAAVHRVLDLHENLGLPVDVYLTTTMVDLYASGDPALLDRLKSSPRVAVSWHVRPPAPYAAGYDWRRINAMPFDEQLELVRQYETQGIDLETGAPAVGPGGYAHAVDVIGSPPWSAGALSDAEVIEAVEQVFIDYGASFTVLHSDRNDLGKVSRRGLALKPEHHDLKLFETVGRSAPEVLDEAIADATANANGTPAFVGVKMHDNDWFAAESAWLTTYMKDTRRPPWDLSVKSALISDDEQAAMWTTYEAMANEVANRSDSLSALNLAEIDAR